MSSDWKEMERRIATVTKSGRRPVAVTFLDGEPADIEKFEGSEPSSCSFWRLAANGRTFYTLPESHFTCGGILHAQYPIVGQGTAAAALNDLKIWRGKADRNLWPASGQFTSHDKSGEVTNEFLSSGGDPNNNCGIGSQDR
jgi:hypothetical protein